MSEFVLYCVMLEAILSEDRISSDGPGIITGQTSSEVRDKVADNGINIQ